MGAPLLLGFYGFAKSLRLLLDSFVIQNGIFCVLNVFELPATVLLLAGVNKCSVGF